MVEQHLHRNDWHIPEPRATVIIVHGHGEYSKRYSYTAEALNAHGYSVVSGDLPGNGQSPGLRGHIDSFTEYLDVVDRWVNEVLHSSDGGKPLFLLGHSGGGVIVTRYLQSISAYHSAMPITGAILSSPALRLKLHVPSWKALLGRSLNWVMPRFRLATGLRESNVSRAVDNVTANAHDPLMVHVASVRYYNELLHAQITAMREASTIRLPLLILHGGIDPVADPSASVEFVEKLSSADKEVRVLTGLYHEILNEPERDEVIRQIVDWLERQINKKA